MSVYTVEVVYALPQEQQVFALVVPEGSTVQAVIERSGILAHYPDIDLLKQAVGIFGQIVKLTTPVEANDRVEIYRPLVIDPMEARRRRAKQQLCKKP